MLINNTAPGQLLDAIDALGVSEGEVLLLLFAEQNAPDIPALVAALNERGLSFIGGIFPGLVYGNKQYSEGCILKTFKSSMAPFMVTDIAASECRGLPELDAIELPVQGTCIILVDGLTPNIYRFLEKLNDLLGEQCSFIGGGAGSISLKPAPCVFSNEGFVKDAAVVCVIESDVRLGVRHGWRQMAGPLVATETDGNTIYQLNWRPAFEVYKEIIESDEGVHIDAENFGSIAQGYPFGILRDMAEDIVRDPLAVGENGEIICIGEVPANTVLFVLKGEKSALLGAAEKAILDCGQGARMPLHSSGTFVVDCITRTLFLDEHFSDEMDIIRRNVAIEKPTQEPFGVLSLGEISSYGEGALELFNKTIVIGAFS